MITLKELVNEYQWKNIYQRFIKLYPDQRKSLRGYKKVFKELQKLEPKTKGKRKLLIECYSCHDIDGEYYTSVHGVTPQKRGNTWALKFTNWQEWLAMEIWPSTGIDYSDVDIICHCLYEMTFWGYDNDKIQKDGNLLIKSIKTEKKNLESGKAKIISWNEAKRRLGVV